jgi:hypothetical protein
VAYSHPGWAIARAPPAQRRIGITLHRYHSSPPAPAPEPTAQRVCVRVRESRSPAALDESRTAR